MNRKRATTNRKTQPFITFVKFLPCAVVAVVAGIAAGTSADTPPPPAGASAPLSLQQCIDTALEKNHGHTASRFSMEIAEAQHSQTLSA